MISILSSSNHGGSGSKSRVACWIRSWSGSINRPYLRSISECSSDWVNSRSGSMNGYNPDSISDSISGGY